LTWIKFMLPTLIFLVIIGVVTVTFLLWFFGGGWR
jgi:hypothetical protein